VSLPCPHRVKFASPSPGQVCLALGGVPRSSGHTPGRVCLALGGSSLPCPRWVKFASCKASSLRPPRCLLPPPEATGGPKGPPRVPLILLETIQAGLPLSYSRPPPPPPGSSLPRPRGRPSFLGPHPGSSLPCPIPPGGGLLWKTCGKLFRISVLFETKTKKKH
jgi:hypothetical protein